MTNIAVNPMFLSGISGWVKDPLDISYGWPAAKRVLCWSDALTNPGGYLQAVADYPPAVLHQGPGPIKPSTAIYYRAAKFPLHWSTDGFYWWLDWQTPGVSGSYRPLALGSTPAESIYCGFNYIHGGDGFEIGENEVYQVTLNLWRNWPDCPWDYVGSPASPEDGLVHYALDHRVPWSPRFFNAKTGADASDIGTTTIAMNDRSTVRLAFSSPELAQLGKLGANRYGNGEFSWAAGDVYLEEGSTTATVTAQVWAPAELWVLRYLDPGDKIHVFLSVALSGREWLDSPSQVAQEINAFNVEMATPDFDPSLMGAATSLDSYGIGFGATWGLTAPFELELLPAPPPLPRPPGTNPCGACP